MAGEFDLFGIRNNDSHGKPEKLAALASNSVDDFIEFFPIPPKDTGRERSGDRIRNSFNRIGRQMAEQLRDSASKSTIGVPADILTTNLHANDLLELNQIGQENTFIFGVKDYLRKPFRMNVRDRYRRFSLDHLDFYHSITARDLDNIPLVQDRANADEAQNVILAYLTDLFLGRFQDRNGVKLAFEIPIANLDLTKLASLPTSVAPKAAGEIVSTVIEAICDAQIHIKDDATHYKHVAFYDSAILSTYRAQRTAKQQKAKLKGDKPKELKKPYTIVDLMDYLRAHGQFGGFKPTGDLDNDFKMRGFIRELGSLEAQYDVAENAFEAADKTITNYKADQQKAFTCCRAGLITTNIQGIFLRNSANGEIGNTSITATGPLDRYDFSDLIGTITACAAKSSQDGVKSIVGAIIRGLAIAGLNNEVLAEVIGAFFGTIAKKVAEAFAFAFMTRLIAQNPAVEEEKKAQEQLLRDLIALYTNHIIPAPKPPN